MTNITHDSPSVSRPSLRSFLQVAGPMWASLAIAVMWLAVLFDAVFGPDIITTSATTSARVPSAVAVALFAFLATGAVARYGFRDDEPSD